MNQSLESVVYWFRQDLRLHDNIALQKAHAASKNVLHVTHNLTDEMTSWGFKRHSENRHLFRQQAIDGLTHALQQHKQKFISFDSSITNAIVDLACQHNTKHIFCETLETPEELQQLQNLKDAGMIVHDNIQSSLYEDDQLPFTVAQTPDIFTTFRQSVEQSNLYKKNQSLHTPLASVYPLSQKPNLTSFNHPRLTPALDELSSFPFNQSQWFGDEYTALQHVSRYFSSQLAQTYKLTRNELTGTNYSTHFSPWLAHGALSPRKIWQGLKKHETEFGANESTYWISFELLWREHFRLMARKHGAALFRQNGLKNKHQDNESYPSNQRQRSRSSYPSKLDTTSVRSARYSASTDHTFKRWQTGETDHSLINAAMQELAATGFLSNRLRQIVASYAIHDLGINWLAGAAWFEHCLIDYDVHSNQGNWAYIAGVGTDPRGGRRFNTDKQMKEYDPDGVYQKRWQA
jgi:deoxyribodipyrimidine photo-lyase